jgi:hypothetical protein
MPMSSAIAEITTVTLFIAILQQDTTRTGKVPTTDQLAATGDTASVRFLFAQKRGQFVLWGIYRCSSFIRIWF